MVATARQRLQHMKDAIKNIRALLLEKDSSALADEPVTRAAYERFLEILSEASRHVPQAWKEQHAEIPWRQVADLGNHFRHGYDKIDLPILWNVYAHDLDAIEMAVDAMMMETGEDR
ncbi:MAG: DUF86 domain-containing protein [Beijerinckiaceae bacterium]|nr:MAG: DUF86 domain-containing protein [Beijerinckiaceae bacterium]